MSISYVKLLYGFTNHKHACFYVFMVWRIIKEELVARQVLFSLLIKYALFSIPTHQFLFNAGQINPKEYMDALMVEPSEFELIKYPERGTCLYRCGNERYLLQVIAPDYKAAMFGKAGGR